MKDFNILKDIKLYPEWTKIKLVDKGWSSDKKYFITDKLGEKFLLRVSSIDEYDKKKMEYERVKMVSKLGIFISIPIEFGVCGNGEKVYSLLSWIDGEGAQDILPKMTKDEQYEFGIQAGQILQKMHTIKASVNQQPWGERYKCKIYRVIEKYYNCGININNENNIITFIKNNISYLDGRHNTFQHGDYHVGNLIITPDRQIGVIDFNRSSFGDPWEEYDRYVFTWKTSIPFAIGQIHGYFNNKVPDEFFRLMSLYNATNIIASIPWAIPFGKEEINTMLTNANEINNSYNGFKTYIPEWYNQLSRE